MARTQASCRVRLTRKGAVLRACLATTAHLWDLIGVYTHTFLQRPPRFGPCAV